MTVDALRVLIVDDHPYYAETLASRLATEGWKIATATSGEEALEIIQRRERIDILASDFFMAGGIDGAELINQALAIRPELFTVIFTGHNERTLAIKALHAGADSFLDKNDGIDQALKQVILGGIQRMSLAEIGRALLNLDDEEEIFNLVFREIKRVSSFESSCLAVRGPTSGPCRVERAINFDSGTCLSGEILNIESAYRYVIERETVYLPPLFTPKDRRLVPHFEETQSIVVVPITLFAGERGALGVESHLSDRLFIEDLRYLKQIADWLSLALERLTHQRRAAAERGRARTLQDTLIRSLLHEIGTPLSHVSIIADETTSGLCDEDRSALDGAVDRIHRSVNHFLQPLIDPQSAPERVDVEAVVREAVAWLRLEDPGVSARLRLEVAPGLPTVDGRPELLASAFVNLLENAAASAAEIRIHASYVAGRDCVEVIVQDNGPGIPAEETDRIFDYGFSTKGPGHGFGLALAKEIIVSLHQGSISLVPSNDACGATFRVRFPVRTR